MKRAPVPHPTPDWLLPRLGLGDVDWTAIAGYGLMAAFALATVAFLGIWVARKSPPTSWWSRA